jgi:hypothetical protein
VKSSRGAFSSTGVCLTVGSVWAQGSLTYVVLPTACRLGTDKKFRGYGAAAHEQKQADR